MVERSFDARGHDIGPDLFGPVVRRVPLSERDRKGIIRAVQSVFLRAEKLYKHVEPLYTEYGFRPPSTGVMARDLSEQIEGNIVLQCDSFTRGKGHADLDRNGERWEVKIKTLSGLTINQSSTIAGETYIVANYSDVATLRRIFVLWGARDAFFSTRSPLSNARRLLMSVAQPHIELLWAK